MSHIDYASQAFGFEPPVPRRPKPARLPKFDLNRRTPEDEQRFNDMLSDIARREGGFSNDPDDKGGPTNFGISLKFMRQYRIDNNEDRNIDINDVKGVTPEQAASLIKENIYYARRINLMPEDLQPLFLDSAVNVGEYGWAKLLQSTLNDMGATDASGRPLDIDGAVGQRTLEAVENAVERYGWEAINNRYVDARVKYHRRRVEEDSTQKKFLQGWIDRAMGFKKK